MPIRIEHKKPVGIADKFFRWRIVFSGGGQNSAGSSKTPQVDKRLRGAGKLIPAGSDRQPKIIVSQSLTVLKMAHSAEICQKPYYQSYYIAETISHLYLESAYLYISKQLTPYLYTLNQIVNESESSTTRVVSLSESSTRDGKKSNPNESWGRKTILVSRLESACYCRS